MLRKNIMTLQLQPGCQLSEAELCEQLAMSRTPAVSYTHLSTRTILMRQAAACGCTSST